MENQMTLEMAAIAPLSPLPCSEWRRNGRVCRALELGIHKVKVLQIEVTDDELRQMQSHPRNNAAFDVVPDWIAEIQRRNTLRILGFDWEGEFRNRISQNHWPHVTFLSPNVEARHGVRRQPHGIACADLFDIPY